MEKIRIIPEGTKIPSVHELAEHINKHFDVVDGQLVPKIDTGFEFVDYISLLPEGGFKKGELCLFAALKSRPSLPVSADGLVHISLEMPLKFDEDAPDVKLL